MGDILGKMLRTITKAVFCSNAKTYLRPHYRSLYCYTQSPSLFFNVASNFGHCFTNANSFDNLRATSIREMKTYVTPGAPLTLGEVERRVIDVFRAFDKVKKDKVTILFLQVKQPYNVVRIGCKFFYRFRIRQFGCS